MSDQAKVPEVGSEWRSRSRREYSYRVVGHEVVTRPIVQTFEDGELVAEEPWPPGLLERNAKREALTDE